MVMKILSKIVEKGRFLQEGDIGFQEELGAILVSRLDGIDRW
jgi:hypothetical protein